MNLRKLVMIGTLFLVAGSQGLAHSDAIVFLNPFLLSTTAALNLNGRGISRPEVIVAETVSQNQPPKIYIIEQDDFSVGAFYNVNMRQEEDGKKDLAHVNTIIRAAQNSKKMIMMDMNKPSYRRLSISTQDIK